MTLVFAANCKACGKLSVVRYSESDPVGRRIDIPNPSLKHSCPCPHCGHMNEFVDSELREVNAEIIPPPVPKPKKKD